MSSEAWVMCRERPALPATGELDEGRIHYSVHVADADVERLLRHIAPEVPPGELRWLVRFSLTGDWYDSFEAGGTALARRCGGGVLWSPLWGARAPALMVAAQPDPGSWTLVEALESAFWLQSDLDEREWQEEQDEIEGRAPRSPAPAPARAPVQPTPIRPAAPASPPTHAIGKTPRIVSAVRAAGRSTWATSCLVWQSSAGDVAAVFSGLGGREAVADLTDQVGRGLSDPPMSSASERATWPIRQAHEIAVARSRAAPNMPANASMATVAWDEAQLFIAHVGAARVYRLRPSQNQFERLTTDDVLGDAPPEDNIVTHAVGMAQGFRIRTRELAWFPDDVLILCSASVWRSLGEQTMRAMVTELREDAATAMIERVSELAPDSGAAVALVFERAAAAPTRTPRPAATSPSPSPSPGATRQASFVLHRSAHACVRLESTDRVLVELPGRSPVVVRRADIRRRAAMLVRIYRARHDPSFAGADDDIVVPLPGQNPSPAVLGPFPHAEGIAIADALELAGRVVLFATPGFSVSVAADAAAIVIATSGQAGTFTVPVPTDRLAELRLRDEPDRDPKYAIPTGFEPAAGSRWLALEFLRGRPWSLGPLPAAAAEQLALEFRRWRADHPIDVTPVPVDANALFAEPTRWHTRRIDVVARWDLGFERSSIGDAWLEIPDHVSVSDGSYRARIVGTWIYPRAGAQDGYGHMGCWPGVLRAESIEVLEVLAQPQTSRDGLTGLPKRTAVGLALTQAAGAQQPVAFALLNLDRFKRFNDTHGHPAGDELLRRCAAAIVESLRPADVVARWSGDGFAAVMPGATIDAARELLDRVHARVRALGVTVSAGLVVAGRGETSSATCERADRALYEAKRSGRDRTVVLDAAR